MLYCHAGKCANVNADVNDCTNAGDVRDAPDTAAILADCAVSVSLTKIGIAYELIAADAPEVGYWMADTAVILDDTTVMRTCTGP